MLAIVLSCDKYHPLTDHMISCYVRKWPSNPFVFRVPYQEFPQSLAWKFGSKIELVRTPRNIKKTVLSLLSDLDEDEWIYWCIDDKYLVEIDEAAANKSLEWIGQLDNPMDCGIMFCRWVEGDVFLWLFAFVLEPQWVLEAKACAHHCVVFDQAVIDRSGEQRTCCWKLFVREGDAEAT